MTIEVTVKGKNIEVTDGLKDYAEKRLQRLERYLPGLHEAVVRECVEHNQHRVEVTLEGNGVLLRGEERSSNMYASVDLVLEKLEQRLKKYKDRHSHHPHHDRSVRKNVEPTNQTVFTEVLNTQSEEAVVERPFIARVKRVTMKPINAGEAAEMMELIDHDFYAFLDEETRRVQVIYKRRDGNYGLLMPKE